MIFARIDILDNMGAKMHATLALKAQMVRQGTDADANFSRPQLLEIVRQSNEMLTSWGESIDESH